MKKLILIYLTLFAFNSLLFAQQQKNQISNLEIPKTTPSDIIITHIGAYAGQTDHSSPI